MYAAQRTASLRRDRRQREDKTRRNILIGAAVVVALIVGALVATWQVYMNSTRDVTVTVTDKNRVCSGDGNGGVSCQYLIFTSGGTFKDTDSLVAGKFASSDLYGQIQAGKTYTFHVRGYRVPIMSEYPNILRIVRVGK